MSGLGCCFWWLVLGALLGWLASWLFGRMFAKTEEEVAPVMAAPTRVSADGIDYAAARAAGYVLTGPENLEIIEGIGPSIAHLLRSSGVNTFAKLAHTTIPALQAILDRGGQRFRTANPQTWAEQATLAVANRWADLRRLQDALDAGLRRD
jgi:predicted flap endonuclease-1-like 5' DNA nuclease